MLPAFIALVGMTRVRRLSSSVGLDVGVSSFLVLPAFIALVGMTRVRRLSSSTSTSTSGLRGGDDVPYNIKDQL